MEEAAISAPDADMGRGKHRVFRAGTLVYSLPGLFALMFWLLLGDFCFYLMENVVPSALPVVLGKLEAPNWMIALFLTTIPSLFNATVCPVVSYLSDRHRSPAGRRIPFISRTIPFLCLFLILLGLAPKLGENLSAAGWFHDPRIATLLLLGIFLTGFGFFNMFVASIYYYLFNDVVPHQFLGRFLAVFRLVGAAAGSVYFLYVFPRIESHFLEICVGAAILYGGVFYLMCRNVREGEYPPPTPLKYGNSVVSGIKTFFIETFSHRLYCYFYLFVAFWAVAANGSVFQIFFARSAGLNLEQFGLYSGVAGGVSALLLLPGGVLSDKLTPLRTLLFAAAAQSIMAALPLVFLFFPIPQAKAFAVWCIVFGINLPFLALFTASELPAYMQIFPQQQYGQFSAATALVRSLVVVVFGLLCGLWMDWLKGIHADSASAYRYLPLWPTFFYSLATICLFLVRREWKRISHLRAA